MAKACEIEADSLSAEAAALDAEETKWLEQIKACERQNANAEETLAEAHWQLLQVSLCRTFH